VKHSSTEARGPSRASEPEPPYNWLSETERGALGCPILGGPASLARLSADLTPEDFSCPAHGAIFRALQSLAAQGLPLELHLLAYELGKRGDLLRTQELLPELVRAAIVPALDGYMQVIREHAIRRRGIDAARRLAEALRDPTCVPESCIQTHCAHLNEIVEAPARLSVVRPGGRDAA